MKFVAYKEDTWLDEITDRAMWTQLLRAFGYEKTDLLMVNDWDASYAGGLPTVVFEQAAKTSLVDFVHPAECCYVFGKTNLNDLVTLVSPLHQVVIPTPKDISLFGYEACAIALWDRHLKSLP